MEVRILTKAEDITPEIMQHIEDTVDRFEDGPMPTDEFIDRLCDTYANGWDIESYDNPVVRKIMRLAREIKRDRVA